MISDITDFLPYYQELAPDAEFIKSILTKAEFYKEKLERTEAVETVDICKELKGNVNLSDIKPGKFLKHQVIISRFISSYTPYDRLFVVHQMGTGKTKVAIAVLEAIRNAKGSINRAIICAKNNNLLNNFRDELVCRGDGYYLPADYKIMKAETRERRINKKLNEFYDFSYVSKAYKFGYTFFQLAKTVSRQTDEQLIQNFSNHIIVVDEIHNIRDKDEINKEKQNDEDVRQGETIEIYKQLHRLFHTATNIKVLLMSGTPIRDTIDEIADIVNLLVPMNKQLPTGKTFLNDYFNKTEEHYTMKPEMVSSFKDLLLGRVSYLRAITSEVPKVFMGELIGDLKHFIVEPIKMSNFQTENYLRILDEDDTSSKNSFWQHSIQASMFIYPDGSSDAGFNKYITQKELRILGTSKTKKVYVMIPELNNLITGSEEDKLQKIGEFSAKYEKAIRLILKSYRDKKSQFVYCNWVKGSGCILFSLLLEKFGFSKANGNETTPGMRYALLTGEKSNTAKDFQRIKNRFNQPDNKFGEYINIIIGSRVVTEGYSFFNIQTEHILSWHWNYAETEQAEARGYRYGSHVNLIEAGIKPELRIYQYVAIPNQRGMSSSIDYRMAKISEDKDVSIKFIERYIKESSFDCALTYDRNLVMGQDGSRECDYQECKYYCDYISPEYYIGDTIPLLDYSTYQLYYGHEDIEKIKEEVVMIFHNNFKLSYAQIIQSFDLSKYTNFQILSALKEMIDDNNPITNKYGFKSYLRENNNIYYLSNSFISNDLFADYYTENIITKEPKSYLDIISELQLNIAPTVISKVFNSDTPSTQIPELLQRLPEDIRELVLSNVIQAEKERIPLNSSQRKIVIENLKPYYDKIGEELYASSLQVGRCLDLQEMKWTNCSEEQLETIQTFRAQRKARVGTQYEGYYGLYNATNDKFCILIPKPGVRQKASQKATGVACGTGSANKTKLIELLTKVFKVTVPGPDIPDTIIKGNQAIWKSIQDRTSAQIIQSISSDKTTQSLYTLDELKDLSLDKLQTIEYWRLLNKDETCKFLKDWFESNDLLIPDSNCGTVYKKKKET